MSDKLIQILLIALVVVAVPVEYAMWSGQTGTPFIDIILFRA